MTILLIIIFGVLIGIMGYLMFKKSSSSAGGVTKPPIEESENYEIPQKQNKLTFTEFSEDEAESPKEVAKNVSKWNKFSFLYFFDGKWFCDASFTRVAHGIYVVESSTDKDKYIYYRVNNGSIVEQGINSKKL